MNRHTIRITLDPSSVEDAVRELEDYQERLQNKVEELRKRIAELIRDRAEPVFQSAIASDTFKSIFQGEETPEGPIIGGVTVTVNHKNDVSVVIATGKDAVFMEFGAGVYHNGALGSSPNPLGAALGYTIGSYGPNGAKDVWGYYDENKVLHLTHGTPASMPLTRAMAEVVYNIVEIAGEVFNE